MQLDAKINVLNNKIAYTVATQKYSDIPDVPLKCNSVKW